MHTPDEIMRRLERGLATIAIQFGQLAAHTRNGPVYLSTLDVIDNEMQRMHFLVTELRDAQQRGHEHERTSHTHAHRQGA